MREQSELFEGMVSGLAHYVLAAAGRTDERIAAPDAEIIDALLTRKLIKVVGDGHVITREGRTILGVALDGGRFDVPDAPAVRAALTDRAARPLSNTMVNGLAHYAMAAAGQGDDWRVPYPGAGTMGALLRRGLIDGTGAITNAGRSALRAGLDSDRYYVGATAAVLAALDAAEVTPAPVADTGLAAALDHVVTGSLARRELARVANHDYGTCQAATAEGVCGRPLDAYGHCDRRAEHWGDVMTVERRSASQEALSASVERQAAAARALAERLGWTAAVEDSGDATPVDRLANVRRAASDLSDAQRREQASLRAKAAHTRRRAAEGNEGAGGEV